MRDVFIEHMVKRKSTVGTVLLKAGIIAAAAVLSVLMFSLSGLLGPLGMIGSLLALGAIWGGYYLATSLNVEFEYAVTNGELDVDKIVAQRKRSRLASVNCREVEAFGRYKPGEHEGKQYGSRVLACDDPASPDVWYLTVRKGENGLTLIVFNADERMLTAIKPFLPRAVMQSAFSSGV